MDLVMQKGRCGALGVSSISMHSVSDIGKLCFLSDPQFLNLEQQISGLLLLIRSSNKHGSKVMGFGG